MSGAAKVLVVDDEPGMRELLSAELSKRGFEVETAGDGEEALAKARRGGIALVVSDVMMPRLGGIEMLKRLRQTSPDTAVIMISGYGTVGSAVSAMKLGAFDYLEKPFGLERFAVAVDRAVGKRNLEFLVGQKRVLAASNVRIIQAVLSLTQAGTRVGAFVRCDAGRFVHAALAELSPLIRDSGARVEVGPLPAVYGNPALLEMLFLNLIENSLKDAKPDVPLRVRVTGRLRGDGRVELIVANEGVAFADADADRDLNPFVRLTADAEEAGLALCAHIVELHAGTILERGGRGGGSEFILALPSALQARAPRAQ